MLNYIWLCFLVVAVLVGGCMGKLPEVTKGAFETAKTAVVDIALPLTGAMAIWMGVMRLAEQAGLVQLLARGIRPLMRFLFPEVPGDHPANGAIVMNMAANMLGLGNAATPLGLRAMALLEKLNGRPGVASDAMCMLLAINTASIQLLPTTAISLLAIGGAADPFKFIPCAFLATLCSACVGVLAAKFFQRLPIFAVERVPQFEAEPVAEGAGEAQVVESVSPAPLRPFGVVVLGVFVGFFVWFFACLVWPAEMGALGLPVPPVPEGFGGRSLFVRLAQAGALLAVPLVLVGFPLYAAVRGVRVYEQFTRGAREAFQTATNIIPFLVAMLVAVRMLREAGVIQAVTGAVGPWLAKVGFPADVLPLVLLRPLSGSASQGIFVDLIKTHGADSFVAQLSATIYGSTETTFYVLAVYFGSVRIRATRHAVLAGLTADVTAFVAALFFARLLLG